MTRTYLIKIQLTGTGSKIELLTTAKGEDLTALLLAFESSPSVDSYSVHNTLYTPHHQVLGNLRPGDLGFPIEQPLKKYV